MIDTLSALCDAIRGDFAARSAARDAALTRSRELTRRCAEAIRAIHRRQDDAAAALLDSARAAADELRADLAPFPDLLNAGYTQDALKELVEAFAMRALIHDAPLPTPEALGVMGSTYLNGLAEAATELRRFILDILRRDDAADADRAECERLMAWMDAIYDQLVTFDFPDAITGDLRRRTDAVRGVLERTRGDLTLTVQQARLTAALIRAEARLDHP